MWFTVRLKANVKTRHAQKLDYLFIASSKGLARVDAQILEISGISKAPTLYDEHQCAIENPEKEAAFAKYRTKQATKTLSNSQLPTAQ